MKIVVTGSHIFGCMGLHSRPCCGRSRLEFRGSDF